VPLPLAAFLFLACIFIPAIASAETKTVTSKNGITAWLIEDHSLPVISLSIAFQGGIEEDSDDKQGLGYIGANMLTQGAGEDDANSFQQKMKDSSIALNFEARRDAVYGSLRSLKETWPEAQRLLKESLAVPRFDADALEREKARTASALKLYLSNPDWLLSRLEISQVFAGHPYERRTLGTFETQKNITVDDLKKWHARLSRKKLVVGAAGDITPGELTKLLDEVFAGLQPGKDNAAVRNIEMKGGGGMFELKHPGAQTEVMLAYPGIPHRDKDWYAAEVMNYILGGGSFSSRLMDEIRDKRGLTYGISSAMMLFDHSALYIIQASSANANVASVLDLTRKEIAKMRDGKVSAEELQEAKDYLIGSYAIELTSTRQVAQYLSELQRMGLPRDEQEKHAAGINAVTVDDVQRVARRLLPEGREAVFLVGAPEGVKPTKVFEKID
jgi:zinc protease